MVHVFSLVVDILFMCYHIWLAAWGKAFADGESMQHVVPAFTKSRSVGVHITPISLWFMVPITIVNGVYNPFIGDITIVNVYR
jgi:hypothetical protein